MTALSVLRRQPPTHSPARAPTIAELVAPEALAEIAPAWRRLSARALEPNPFAEPEFLLPLLEYERPKRLAFALIWRGERLIGLAGLTLPRLGLARAWMSAHAALPAAMFDRDERGEAVAATAALLARRTRLAGIVWPFVERGGPFAAALATAGDLPLGLAGSRRRAALRLEGAKAFDAGLDSKRATKWARKARKLVGEVTATSGSDGVEAFFEVERKGWKGERGTALAGDPARLAFARAALSSFAAAGRLDTLTLRLDGKPVAAGLALIAGGRAFYWKTAYDEAHSAASPGIQLTLRHSRRLADRPELTLSDSCAIEDHPMIGRVWGDALTFDDVAMGLRPGAVLGLWLGLAKAKATAREQLKRWAYRALGRKWV